MFTCKTCAKSLSETAGQCTDCGDADPFYFSEMTALSRLRNKKYMLHMIFWLAAAFTASTAATLFLSLSGISYLLMLLITSLLSFQYAIRDDATAGIRQINQHLFETARKSRALYLASNPCRSDRERNKLAFRWWGMSGFHQMATSRMMMSMGKHDQSV